MTDPRSARFYRPELDVLRFGAFALVFMRHGPHGKNLFLRTCLLSGQAGVCVFFMLSAYLITELMEREVLKTGTVNLRSFYIRRILRIWPLYFLALLLARLIDWHAPHLQMSNARLLASLLLAGNWYTFWHGFPDSFALVLWSISVEEQFYLVWPSVRKYFGQTGLVVASALTIPISYIALFWLGRLGATNAQLWMSTFSQLQFFGLGALLALGLRGKVLSLPPAARLLLVLCGLASFTLAQAALAGRGTVELNPTTEGVLEEFLLMFAGSFLIFAAALGAAVRERSLWVRLGRISYGLYVFHLLCYRLSARPIQTLTHSMRLPGAVSSALYSALALILSVLLAHLSYRYFEAYFLRLKQRFELVRSRGV